MPTSKEYRDLILDKLDLLENISYKSMMGEYLIYYNKILFGGIYEIITTFKEHKKEKKEEKEK